ncbi:hypothetical protein [Actinomadura parmotrematis]|uniref:WXG100 family type VII secretion target n=1 Tax=Actinomadura parmotrematis TaxID=2864039 RepID=A0ABS7G4R9_9ACTN|nr:hypothetical protein [Actinomadura parmotrematis]MBW8487375.1 hypothetical protein [Actinomadura parmotrematis]
MGGQKFEENPGDFENDPREWDPVEAADGNVPVWSQIHKGVSHGRDGDFGSVAGDIADLGATGWDLWMDPLNALISAGLGFLIDWCEPLKSAVSWVTGNAGAIEQYRDNWGIVQEKLETMSRDLDKAITTGLSSWKGPASQDAGKRLREFQEGVRGTIGEIGELRGLLALSAGLMDAALDVVKSILAEFVEWLILTWLAAQAAAVPTLGASEVAASGATAGEAAVATSRAMAVIQKVSRIFKRLMEMIAKIRASLTRIGVKAYRPLAYEARHAEQAGHLLNKPQWKDLRETAQEAQGKGVRDFRPKGKDVAIDIGKAIGIKGGGGATQAGQDGYQGPFKNQGPEGNRISKLLGDSGD